MSGYAYYLLGVMQGFFPEALPIAVEVREVQGASAQNSGIAAVIPAEKILHILDSPRAKAYIEAAVQRDLKAMQTKPP